MDEELDLWEAHEMLNESRIICVVMVWDLEEGCQQTERMNVMSFMKIMKVHWFGASNTAK